MRAARDREPAARHERLARQWAALQDRAAALAEALASAQETRRQWAALTEPTRRLAVASDVELRRRYPDRHLPPLRSAEPEAAPGGLALGGPDRSGRTDPAAGWSGVSGLAAAAVGARPSSWAAGEQAAGVAGQREVGDQPGVEVGPGPSSRDLAHQIARIMAGARAAQERIDELAATACRLRNTTHRTLGPAWTVMARRDREAIIQPPRPHVVPARAVLDRSHDCVTVLEMEAE